jgi:hypothetical protein
LVTGDTTREITNSYGVDSLKKFAAEGRSLNLSRTGSYGDLSTQISSTENGIRNGDMDGDSDMSLSNDDENLLEEVIATMSKSTP